MGDSLATKEEQRAIQAVRSIRGTYGGTFLDFIHFLLDYNIIGYASAFVIAVSASELFNSIGRVIVHTTLKALRLSEYIADLLKDLISFLIVVVLVFFLMYFIIQPIVNSRQVQEERKVKQVVKATEEQKIEKTAERVESSSDDSLSTIGKSPIDSFTNGSFSNVYSMF